ncbi:ufm1-specific protease 2-like [Hemiscyllium ocellatum]|uniref:ufm1-specific protease 2-like n=1 Tax=Hemiscyllium ocellatum TaxID=170820 RepID=UPI0029666815|nr:ufm1-specific protease 2-like [Hemiscyllium ocellatum]
MAQPAEAELLEQGEEVGCLGSGQDLIVGDSKIINMQILFEMVQADNTEEVVIHHRKMSHIHFKLVLPIDVVVLANPEEPWGKVQDQFVEAVTAQLSAMDNCIERYTNGKTVPIPQAFHFELPEKTTLTTVIYPAGISDTNLEQQRKELQTELGLDNKPYFRRPMVYVFPSAERETKYLKNVHKYIPALNPDDYKDNEKDKKWGALYRCLQVVISWFKFQGYIDKPVPTVKEIREMLIKMDEEFVPIVLANEWLAPDEMLPFLEFYNISCSSTEERFGGAQVKPPPVGSLLREQSSGTMAVSWQGKEFWTEMAQFGLIMPKRPEGV